MKTIAARLRGAKTELEEMGEDTSGMVESTSKLRQEVMALSGVDIMLNESTFKDPFAVFDELSAKWDSLTDIQTASLIELLAGKHQANVFASLMSNFDTAREALETSLNSSGSAMKEHEKWSQSLEAQLLKLKAAWQGLSQAFLSSDFLKGALNVVIELVDGLAKLIDTVGAVPALLTVFAGFKGLKTVFSTINNGGNLKELGNIFGLLQKSFPGITGSVKKLTTYLREMSLASGGAGSALGGLMSLILQHPYIAAAAAAVAVLTGVFVHQKKKAEELSKEVADVTSKYKEQHNELIKLKSDYDTSNESSMISKYAKLSKGVDGLGRNVSLTADEYSEYQSIVNSIAEQIPSLVSGYDDQGNAILSCKGNVEELTNAYQKLIHEQNRAVLTNTGNIEKDFSNTLEKQSGTHWWSNNHGFWAGLDIFGWGNYELKTDTAKGIEALLNASSEAEKDRIIRSLQTNMYSGEEIKDVLEGAGIDVKWGENVYDVLEKTLKTDPQKIKNIIDDYYDQFDDAITEQKTIAQAKLSEAFDVSSAISGLDYGNINKELQDIAKQTVNSLDFDFFSNLQEQGKTVEQWTTELLNQLNSISKADNTKIEAAFDLQTKFNGGDISYGEYVKSLKDVGSTIDKLDLKDEAKEQLEISLGLDDSGIVDQYDALVKRLTSKEIGLNDKAAKNFLDSLSAEELDVLVDIIPNLDAGSTIDEIQSLIDEKLATEFTFDISAQITGIEAFNTALSEARSATGLTSESIAVLKGRYEDLDDFNAGALFERTANGVRVNNEELARLEAQYENVNKLDIDKNLSKLVNKYKDLTEKIKTCTDAQKKESLQLQADAYADKIEELQTLASQYDGLTSAFSKWQQAQSSPNDGDNYDSVFESLEALQESYKAGLVGTDDFRTAVQLMSNEDLSTASIDKLVSVYKDGLPKMKRYFTEGQKGCKNFLNDVNKLNSEWAHLNEKGEWEINIDVEEAAEKLNMDVSTIYLILDKLKDYGFEINVDDTSLKNIQTDIEKTEARLKELGRTPQPINLDASDIKTIDGEISKLKTHISEVKNDNSLSVEVKTAELDDARTKLEALIQKKQEASQPAFMNLDTSQVKSSMVEALGYVQDYQESLNNLNMLLELKEAGITIDDSEIDTAQQKLGECAKLIQGLDSEVKLAIGLKEDASIDDIKNAIANGDIVIDTDTSTTNVKIEKLAENIERIEDKDVTITVTIDGLEDVKELNRQIDLATNIDGDIDKLSEYVKGAKALSDLDSNIVTNVTANITGNVKDTPEFAINNLETFAKGAKELKGVGTFSSKVTADIAGNVKDTPEFSINNLKVFSESAKGIEDIGDVKSKVTADIAGNVKDTPEYMINNLKAFTENAKDIDGIGEDVKAKITADIAGNVKDTPEFSINNLKVFTENAKDIENIGEDVKAKITADIEGNVKDTPEFAINNLKVFTDNAKDIEETGNVSSEVTANVKGNVVDTYEYQLDNLKKYTDSAKDIEKTGDVESKVTANVEGNVVDTFEYQLDNLKVFTDNAKDVKNIGNVESSVTANIKGNVTDTFEYKIDNLKSYSDNAADVEKIGSVKSDVEANVSGNVIDEFEYKLNNLKVFSDSAKDVKDIGTVESKVTANVDGNVTDEFEYKLNNLKVFSDSAKDIGNIGNVSSNVEANIDGNVIDEFEYKINNIKVFAEGAKTLKGIGNVESKVEANIDGNVIDEFEYKINNLKVFSDNVKDIKGIGNVESKVTADVGGNVIDTKEYKIDNLKAYTDSAKDVESIGNVTSKVTADVSGNVIDTKEYKIDNLKVYTDSAKKVESIGTVKSSVKADVSGNVIDTKEYKLDNLKVFGESAKKTKDIGTVTSNVTANVNGNVINTTEEKIDNLGVFANNANKLKNTGNFTSSVTATVGGNIITDDTAVTDLEQFASVVSGMTNQTVTVSVTANVDSANINSAISLLSGLNNGGIFKDYTATVQVGAKIAKIDDTTVKNYKAPSKEGKVKYLVDSSKVDSWTAPPKKGVVNYSAKVDALTDAQKHKTGTITYKANIVGLGPAAGTAHVSGSTKANGSTGRAFARGDWGIKGDGVALGGEMGREIVVRDGKFFTIGDEGAQFFRYRKNDIVFNATQTEALLKYGGLKGANPRGKMLASGTAFAEGNAFATASGGGKFYNSSTGQSYGSKSSDSDSSSDKDFEEVIDWIEVIIDRVVRSIDKFDQQANNIYKSWSSRNSALQSEISEVSREINLQQQAYSRYLSAANGVGLSSSWAAKVRNGTIDISTIKDEALADKISSYKEWYEKALSCQDAIRELQEQESKLYAQRFENLQTQYDGILQGYEHTEAMLNEYISQAEEQGYIVSKKYYEALVTNEKQNINALKQEQAELIKTRDEAVASGKITKNSEAWLEQCAAIDEITQAIEESTTALLEFDNAMREIDWSVFDLIQERISDITEESDFLIELMSNKDLFDDSGKFTSQGLATLGLHAQNVNTHMYAADTYGEEVAKLDAQIAKDPYDQELINRRNELLELQRESILAAEQEKDAIKDLVENGIEEQLNSLQELIDKKNEALESERDLYEYQKKVAEQSKAVAILEKELAAYSGDDSEEAKQKIQQIKVDLESARQDLQETEMDKVLEDTSALLDNLFLEAETLLNSRLDNVDALLEQVIETINIASSAEGNIATALGSEGAIAIAVSNNATSIKDALTSETNKVGTTLSNAMNSIWNSGDGNAKSVLTMYGEDFKSKSATIITTLNGIKSSVNSMVSSLNKEATTKTKANKTTTSAKKNPTASSSSSKKKTTTTTTTKKSSSGDGKPKIGDRVKYVSGQYYYDSQGKKPLGSHNKGEYVYITNINTRDWATHGYHISTGNKLGKGDLGWLKLNQLSGYASGKEKFYNDENAWTQEDGREFIVRPSDGAILTPIAKGDSVLNAAASGNIWNMANSPAEFIKENLKLDTSSVPNTSSVNNSIVQNFENITFSMPNVHGYNELLSEMQRDPKFEKFILSMTIDQIAGRSKLAKGKSIR